MVDPELPQQKSGLNDDSNKLFAAIFGPAVLEIEMH